MLEILVLTLDVVFLVLVYLEGNSETISVYAFCRVLPEVLVLLVRMVCLVCPDPLALLDPVDVLERRDLL